jgi:hypothetical protein
VKPAGDNSYPEAKNAEERPRAGGRRPKQPAKPMVGEWVRYDQYERKEARLRDDQYGRLTAASRRLNRQRKGEGERITENTLIRVAIDMLLAQEGTLEGKTETDLRRSVGL